MASSLPIVRQVAWLSVLPQLVLLFLLMALAGALNISSPAVVGAIAYLTLSFALRLLVPRAHRKGIRLFKQERFAEAVPCFKDSYEFFSRHAWIDRWRAITMLSSSRISYREMALVNVAFCLGQSGQQQEAIAKYRRVLQEFPESKLAETALRMMEPSAQQSVQPDGPASGGPTG